jgi:hypothetical protein
MRQVLQEVREVGLHPRTRCHTRQSLAPHTPSTITSLAFSLSLGHTCTPLPPTHTHHACSMQPTCCAASGCCGSPRFASAVGGWKACCGGCHLPDTARGPRRPPSDMHDSTKQNRMLASTVPRLETERLGASPLHVPARQRAVVPLLHQPRQAQQGRCLLLDLTCTMAVLSICLNNFAYCGRSEGDGIISAELTGHPRLISRSWRRIRVRGVCNLCPPLAGLLIGGMASRRKRTRPGIGDGRGAGSCNTRLRACVILPRATPRNRGIGVSREPSSVRRAAVEVPSGAVDVAAASTAWWGHWQQCPAPQGPMGYPQVKPRPQMPLDVLLGGSPLRLAPASRAALAALGRGCRPYKVFGIFTAA